MEDQFVSGINDELSEVAGRKCRFAAKMLSQPSSPPINTLVALQS
jgi:hypothetical protein